MRSLRIGSDDGSTRVALNPKNTIVISSGISNGATGALQTAAGNPIPQALATQLETFSTGKGVPPHAHRADQHPTHHGNRVVIARR